MAVWVWSLATTTTATRDQSHLDVLAKMGDCKVIKTN